MTYEAATIDRTALCGANPLKNGFGRGTKNGFEPKSMLMHKSWTPTNIGMPIGNAKNKAVR